MVDYNVVKRKVILDLKEGKAVEDVLQELDRKHPKVIDKRTVQRIKKDLATQVLKLEVDEFFDQKSPEFQKEIVKEYFRRNHESVPVLNITCANGTNITYYKFPCKKTYVNASEDEMDLEEMTVEEDLVEEGDDGKVDTPDNDNNEEADAFTNDLFEKLIIEPPVQDEDNDHNSNENQNDSKRKEYLATEASFTNKKKKKYYTQSSLKQ